MATIAQPLARHRTKSALARREAIEGLLYISPFLLGFLIFTAYPMIASFYLSFTKYNILNPPTWIGLENYQEADGTVTIPSSLRPYMGGVDRLTSRT